MYDKNATHVQINGADIYRLYTIDKVREINYAIYKDNVYSYSYIFRNASYHVVGGLWFGGRQLMIRQHPHVTVYNKRTPGYLLMEIEEEVRRVEREIDSINKYIDENAYSCDEEEDMYRIGEYKLYVNERRNYMMRLDTGDGMVFSNVHNQMNFVKCYIDRNSIRVLRKEVTDSKGTSVSYEVIIKNRKFVMGEDMREQANEKFVAENKSRIEELELHLSKVQELKGPLLYLDSQSPH
jgi:hypothetical protein